MKNITKKTNESILNIIATSVPFASFLAILLDGLLRSSTVLF